MDFTVKKYRELLDSILKAGYTPCTYSDFLDNPSGRKVILRHDVDKLPGNSLLFAEIQNSFGIRATYYFRVTRESWDEKIIKEISSLGHEIGYHYEDVGRAAMVRKFKGEQELASEAFESFCENLAEFRKIVKTETVCMHGLPMSRFDGRLIWKYYSYRELGIKGEPYFDTDFSRVLYLTDTGRRWDGDSVSIRDRASSEYQKSATPLKPKSRISKTDDIINQLKADELPDLIMFTFHPQRWSDSTIAWLRELIFQNLKNIVKYFLLRLRP